jgi:predicted nuclease of predicted toxin-antitoxin system
MKLLLDQGLPRSTVLQLSKTGIEAVHVGEIGMATAEDAEILAFAEQQSRVVVTLDADFHTLLARFGGAGPSVIRVRIEGLRAAGLADLLKNVLEICEEDLGKGAMVSVTEKAVRVRRLPLVR